MKKKLKAQLKDKSRSIAKAIAPALLISSLLAVATGLATRAQDERISNLRNLFFAGQFERVIDSYSHLPGEWQNAPLVCFWTGQSYMNEHDFAHAEELLRKAEAGNLPATQRQRADASLARISTFKQLSPPFFHDYSLDGFTIRIFAKDTPWARSIAAQMPIFLARAKEAFGNSTAYVAFYLIDDRTQYDQFFQACCGNQTNQLHRGTGGRHIVLFCRYYPRGDEVGKNDVSDLYFRVLHEYSHALCNTIYGDQFKMPAYLNEGMADYFGWKFKPAGSQEASKRLLSLASTRAPWTYEELGTEFRKDGDLGYAVGDVIVSKMMQGKPLNTYLQIINLARSSAGNFDSAVTESTGYEPKALYSQVVSEYWGRSK